MVVFLTLLLIYVAGIFISLFFDMGLFALLIMFLGPCCLLFFCIGELYDALTDKDY